MAGGKEPLLNAKKSASVRAKKMQHRRELNLMDDKIFDNGAAVAATYRSDIVYDDIGEWRRASVCFVVVGHLSDEIRCAFGCGRGNSVGLMERNIIFDTLYVFVSFSSKGSRNKSRSFWSTARYFAWVAVALDLVSRYGRPGVSK